MLTSLYKAVKQKRIFDSMLHRLTTLLQYLWYGRSRYHIHSPFVYAFIKKVLRDKRRFYDMDRIALQRALMLKDISAIQVNDLGAGPNNKKPRIAHRKVATIARSTGITRLYGELLFRTVDYYQCKNILELGTGLGVSAMYLASANKHTGRFISIEGDTQIAAIARKNLAALDCRNAEVMIGSIQQCLPNALDQLKHIDLAFMDGDHRCEATIAYFNQLLPYLHENSIVVIDDIHWSEEMTQAWNELRKHPEVKLSIDLYRMGLLFFNPDFRQQLNLTLYYW